MTDLSRYLPILAWLPRYERAWLRPDLIAGLTLWGLVVPQAMAYAGIAGLPPQAGLYTLVASLLVYAIFGSSRHLVVQPTSATSALLASTVLALGIATEDLAAYQAHATVLVLVVGLVFAVAGIARLGFISQFLSKPVMDGFVTGLAIFVAVSQLNTLLGLPKPAGNTVQRLVELARNVAEINGVTLAVGVTALALLFLLPRWNRRIPAGLVVLIGGILLSSAADLNSRFGVEVVGSLPQGLPAPSLPSLPFTTWLSLVLPAMGIVLVANSEALGAARIFADKHGYEVDPDQDLKAYALVNLASGLFGGQIGGGGMSATAVNEGSGAKSQVAGLFTWVLTIATLLLLTPLFASLPEAVLGALIIRAIWSIIAQRRLRQIRLVSRTEFWLGALTMAGVLLIGVLQGMVIGLLASLLLVIYRSSQPSISSLGRVPDVPGVYSDLTRNPENTPVLGALIVRLDAPIYYANALTFRNQVKRMVAESGDALRAVILDAGSQVQLDVTSAEVLIGLVNELQARGLVVFVAGARASVIEWSRRTGLYDLIGGDRMFPTVAAAVRAFEASG